MSNKRYQFFTPSTNRLLIVVGFIGLFALTVWLLSGVPRPREVNRVSSSLHSFSIIHPPDWDVDQKIGDDKSAYLCGMTTSPKKSVGREIRLFTGEYKKPIDAAKRTADGYASIPFQDQPAWAQIIRAKHDYTYKVIFERDGRSFEISIRLPLEDDVPNSEWWPYFQSFRVNPQPATSSATMPG